MGNPWLAWDRGTDPQSLARALRDAHESFVADGAVADNVRPLVSRSWQRSRTGGIDPDTAAPAAPLSAAELEAYRAAHPLGQVLPLVRRLLVDTAAEAGHVVALTDATGRLLWVEGDHALRGQVADMGFVAGAQWSEDAVGTNAPGTALRLDHSLQIFAHEHFSRSVHPWSCSAAPVHDPRTGALLGALDLTGGDTVASPQALALVEAAATAIEAHLLLLPAPAGDGPALVLVDDTWRLQVLGRTDPALSTPRGEVSLSTRHAEILLVLADHPQGMTTEQLADALSDSRLSPVTVRAEVTRLRRIVGSDVVGSRPYRLQVPLTTDVGALTDHLRRGAVRRALDLDAGTVLPQSDAPWVRALRHEVGAELRQAVLRHGGAELLLRYVQGEQGRHDVEALEAALRALPYGSPRRPQVSVLLEVARRG